MVIDDYDQTKPKKGGVPEASLQLHASQVEDRTACIRPRGGVTREAACGTPGSARGRPGTSGGGGVAASKINHQDVFQQGEFPKNRGAAAMTAAEVSEEAHVAVAGSEAKELTLNHELGDEPTSEGSVTALNLDVAGAAGDRGGRQVPVSGTCKFRSACGVEHPERGQSRLAKSPERLGVNCRVASGTYGPKGTSASATRGKRSLVDRVQVQYMNTECRGGHCRSPQCGERAACSVVPQHDDGVNSAGHTGPANL